MTPEEKTVFCNRPENMVPCYLINRDLSRTKVLPGGVLEKESTLKKAPVEAVPASLERCQQCHK